MQEIKYFLREQCVRKKYKIIKIKVKMDYTNVIHLLPNLCKFQANIIMLRPSSISTVARQLISFCSVLSMVRHLYLKRKHMSVYS